MFSPWKTLNPARTFRRRRRLGMIRRDRRRPQRAMPWARQGTTRPGELSKQALRARSPLASRIHRRVKRARMHPWSGLSGEPLVNRIPTEPRRHVRRKQKLAREDHRPSPSSDMLAQAAERTALSVLSGSAEARHSVSARREEIREDVRLGLPARAQTMPAIRSETCRARLMAAFG